SNGEGTIFSINTDGSGFTLLYSFGPFDSGGAEEPIGGNGLTLVGSKLYGMTYFGGNNQNGTIFSINTDGTDFTLLHSFKSSEGGVPIGSLTLAGSQLYGSTTGFSFVLTSGAVFSMNLDGSAFTVIHTFAGSPGDGSHPVGDPVLSNDGPHPLRHDRVW